MVLKKKISEKELQNMLREEVISHGAEVIEDKLPKKKKKVSFLINIEVDVLRQIEEALGGGITTKTAFILQAIHEKLRRQDG